MWPGPSASWSRRCRRPARRSSTPTTTGWRRWRRTRRRASSRTAPTVTCAISGLVARRPRRDRRSTSSRRGVASMCGSSVSGAHMASNAAAALAVAGVVEGSIERAARGAVRRRTSRRCAWTSAVRRAGRSSSTTRTTPTPTRCVPRCTALAGISARRRVAILGPMAELDDAAAGHRQVAAIARELGHRADRDRHGPVRHRRRSTIRCKRSARSARATPCSSKPAGSPASNESLTRCSWTPSVSCRG